MKNIKIITIILVTLLTMSCASHNKDVKDKETGAEEFVVSASNDLQPAGSSYHIPQAVIYQTDGDYDNQVMVNLNNARTAIVSYPATSDVNVNSAPIDLGNGWKLDRRGGVGPNSAFLTYTYAEYAAMKNQPSVKDLYSKIIPDARVTRCVALPININQALENPEAVKKYLPAE